MILFVAPVLFFAITWVAVIVMKATRESEHHDEPRQVRHPSIRTLQRDRALDIALERRCRADIERKSRAPEADVCRQLPAGLSDDLYLRRN